VQHLAGSFLISYHVNAPINVVSESLRVAILCSLDLNQRAKCSILGASIRPNRPGSQVLRFLFDLELWPTIIHVSSPNLDLCKELHLRSEIDQKSASDTPNVAMSALSDRGSHPNLPLYSAFLNSL
jgi:hypothetical protein